MNGHGIILLQDLEDDEDLEYQTGYSNSNVKSIYNFTSSNSSGGGSGSDASSSNCNNNPQHKIQNPSSEMHLTVRTTGGHEKFPYPYHQSSSLSIETPPPPAATASTSEILSTLYSNRVGGGFEAECQGHLTNGYHSSLSSSVNNAITIAPSRATLFEPNVYTGGRPQNHLIHHKKHHHHHRKHKGRSKSPAAKRDEGIIGGYGATGGGGGYDSILNKIDNSIMKNFGDWNQLDESESFQRKQPPTNSTTNNNTNKDTRSNNHHRNTNVPYYLPKRHSTEPPPTNDNDLIRSKNQLCLPQLYKPYETVLKTSKQVLTDKSYRIALSKDNNDPNSILSEAKRTLTQFSPSQSKH